MSLSTASKEKILSFINEAQLSIDVIRGWENFTRNHKGENILVLDIDNIPSLQSILRYINDLNSRENTNISVRAAAGAKGVKNSYSYSITGGAVGDIILRLTGKAFHHIERGNTPNTIQTGASVQIGTLDKVLYEKFDQALPTSSLIPYVTVAGLAANAGHGTGKSQPGFCGLIKAMTICLPNGKIVRIDNNHPDFKTIRAAHLGLFGIIIDMELETIPAKKLQCITEARSVPEFLQELKDGLFDHDPYVSVMYVPTYRDDELTNTKYKNIVIYRFRPIEKTVQNIKFHEKFSNFIQELAIKAQEDFHINHLLKAHPKLVPTFLRYVVSKFSIGTKDKLKIGPWPIIHYQTAYPKDINDVDYLFSVSNDYQEIREAFVKLIMELKNSANKKEYPLTYAAYIRLFQGTKGGLSTSDGCKPLICGFDMVSTPGMKGQENFQKVMQHYFINVLDAKPHWGKSIPNDIDYQVLYGKRYEAFLTTIKNWYRAYDLDFNKSILLNGFARDVLKLPQNKTSQNDLRTACEAILPKISGASLHAENFRKELKRLAAPKNESTFFVKKKTNDKVIDNKNLTKKWPSRNGHF